MGRSAGTGCGYYSAPGSVSEHHGIPLWAPTRPAGEGARDPALQILHAALTHGSRTLTWPLCSFTSRAART